ncbi:transcription termination factor MTERF2, chloroplastic [Mercurialis annua]|uniref:transcription termination factor MTERF2, chloroplastic n=1 Tax=Mercurialis annua TaxID=3986 RepID=UPI002160DB17|nr:transcription termination factor MTERF2, chloroplastic [Mercurialis annua]
MLSCSHYHPTLHHHHHHYNHRKTHHSTATFLIFASTPSNDPIIRTHNSKTSAFLLHTLNQHKPQLQNEPHSPQKQEQKIQEAITQEEKVKLLELTLVTKKRIPQFPGSNFPQFPAQKVSPLDTLFDKDGYDDEEEMIVKAVEIRRKVTAEIFKQVMMKKGKFGITYSTNLADRLSDFIDFVMIKAAALKKLHEFEGLSFNARAKYVIEELDVVPLIRWLKHNGLSYPRIAKLIRAAGGDVESIRRLADWLKSIHVRGEFIGVVLTKAGDNILERGNKELVEIVECLESNGVRRDWMGYVMSRCPKLLSYSLEHVETRVKFYMDMGMNKTDFGTMVFDCPKALGHFTLEEMNQKVDYLKAFGLNNEDVGKLLAFKPELMCCSIEERWKPLVKYFYYLGISRDDMKRILTIKPIVFCVDLEQTILPKVRFFKDVGVREDAIGNMLAKFPTLLTYSLYKKIRPVVIFLMTKAGVSRRDIGKVIALGPQLLGCSITHKLDISVKYYLSLGINIRQLGEMIADFPMLLRYNIDLLRPKYRYLRRTMIRPLRDLIEFPRFFSYSLEGRIIPRHKVIVENGINFKLRYMLGTSDVEFQKMVEAAVERRRRFESGLINVTESNSHSQIVDSSCLELDTRFNPQVADDASGEGVDHFSDTEENVDHCSDTESSDHFLGT